MTISLIRIKFLAVSLIALMLLTGCPRCGYDWNCSSENRRKSAWWKRIEACFEEQRSIAVGVLKENMRMEDYSHMSNQCGDNSSYEFKKDKKYFP